MYINTGTEEFIILYKSTAKKLNIKGNDLLIYSIIYNFHAHEQEFNASLEYLAEFINSNVTTVFRSLQNLLKKNLIKKVDDTNIFNRKTYRIVDNCKIQNNSLQNVKTSNCKMQNDSLQNVKTSICKMQNDSLQNVKTSICKMQNDSLQNVKTSICKMQNNNRDNNRVYNRGDIFKRNIKEKKDEGGDLKKNLMQENISFELKNKLLEFIDYRISLDKPLKTYATIQKLISQIGTDFIDEQHLIDSIDYAIAHEYKSIFPKKILNNNLNNNETLVDKLLKQFD